MSWPQTAADRARRLPRWTHGLAVFIAYTAVSLVLFGLPVIAHLSTVWAGIGTADAKLYAWDLAWWPYALAHHVDPLHARVVFAPTGANMMWVTSMPAPSLLMTPVTLTAGPVVAANLLTLLAPPAAGWACYLAARRLTDRFWPAVAAGLVFGFSTYETTTTRGHLNLAIVVAVPLAVYIVTVRLERRLRPGPFVALLGLDLVVQFLTSTEVFATLTVFAAVTALLALALLHERRRVLTTSAEIAAAYAVAGVALTPFLVAVAEGVPAAPLKDTTRASADLLGFVLPRSTILVGHDLAASTTSRFTARLGEDGTYIGIPLLLVVVLSAIVLFRDPVMRLLVAAFLVVAVASLGPVLHITGRAEVSMPWTVAQHAPLLEHALPVRFSVYSALSVALISARWLAIRRLAWARWGLVLVGLACLVPRVTPEWHPGVHVPRFFAGGTYRRYVERGETIVLLPVTQSMLWQAQTRMYFSMATGRLGVEPSGFEGWHVAKRFRYVSIGPRMIGDVRVFLAAHHVGAIVVSDSQAATWRRALAPLGVRPVHVDGVDVYDVSGAAGAIASAGAAAA